MHPALSLDDFAPRATSGCTVCALPVDVRHELETARRRDAQRFTYPVIAAWLVREHNVDVSDSSLRRHFNRGHDRTPS